MLFKRIEVAVTVQRTLSVDAAPSGQYDADSSANSYAQTSQLSILHIKRPFEQPRLSCTSAAEAIDPHSGVDEYHLSRLIASRPPSQVIFPRSLLISDCCLSSNSVFNPSSATSRLVFKPVARSASAA